MEEVLSTDEIMSLMDEGKHVFLPVVEIDDMRLLQNYDENDLQWLGLSEEDSEIVSIEYIGDDEVQCIMVEDECHQYLTDDFIPTHNTNNIIYLKSNDDQMLQTLETLSGKKHEAHMDSKTITRDTTAIFGKLTGNEGKTSYTTTVKEAPVVSFNDMAYIPERNAITFRAGDSIIWARNEMILPMSWRLHKDTIIDPGHDYSLLTLPTLSSAKEFDIEQFIPNFDEMLAKQMKRALKVEEAKEIHKNVFNLTDYDIDRLPKEDYANTIMDIIDEMIDVDHNPQRYSPDYDPNCEMPLDFDQPDPNWNEETKEVSKNSERNKQQEEANRQAAEQNRERMRPRFAGRSLSQNDIIDKFKGNNHGLDDAIGQVYAKIRPVMEKDTANFTVNSDGFLCGTDGTLYISRSKVDDKALKNIIEDEASKHGGKVHDFNGNADENDIISTYIIHNAFYKFLAERNTWVDIADGKFENEMAIQVRNINNF